MPITTERFDAILIGWSFIEGRLHGAIYADSKKRFTEGEPIITSTVSTIACDMKAGGARIAVTKSGTRYLLS